MKNGLESHWGIVCVPHKSSKYREGIQDAQPTACNNNNNIDGKHQN